MGPARLGRPGWLADRAPGHCGRPGTYRAPRLLSPLLKDAEDVLLAEDQVLLVVQRHFGSRVLAEQDLVAGLDVEGDLLAVLVDLAVADGDHLALLGLFLGAVRNDDAALPGFLLFLPLDEDAVVQRTNLHSQ